MGPDPQITPTARIGVIGDTHGYLDSAVLGLFAGVDHIIHCGDIGDPAILAELETVGTGHGRRRQPRPRGLGRPSARGGVR